MKQAKNGGKHEGRAIQIRSAETLIRMPKYIFRKKVVHI